MKGPGPLPLGRRTPAFIVSYPAYAEYVVGACAYQNQYGAPHRGAVEAVECCKHSSHDPQKGGLLNATVLLEECSGPADHDPREGRKSKAQDNPHKAVHHKPGNDATDGHHCPFFLGELHCSPGLG